MRRFLLLLCFAFAALPPVWGQPLPLRPVPTLVPRAAPPAADAPLTRSALADIQQRGSFRVGVLYNDPPYSELSFRGELQGFDAALLRLIAETWGVELEWVQVTRQNALDRLNRGAVDAVASAFVHYRHLDADVTFSQTYLRGRQSLMVAAAEPSESPAAFIDRPIGYVIGTRAEWALQIWEAQLGVTLQRRVYLTLDRAFAALTQGEVAAVLAEAQALQWVSREYAEQVRILESPVLLEPRAIAIRREDAPLRNLLDKTIQHLAQEGKLQNLWRDFFPNVEDADEFIYLWDGLDSPPRPAQFAAEIPPPPATLPRILEAGALRVGGLDAGGIDTNPDLSLSERRLADLNRALAAELARRWNLALEVVPGSTETALALLEQGQVDLVVGVQPHWAQAETVDFAAPYLLHGDRLMVPANSRISSFNELRGRWVGVLYGDDTAEQRARAWADSINASVRFYRTPPSNAALAILEMNNADVIYASSLSLIPHLEASPSALRLTDRWYSRSYYALGVARNDLDFRLLVDYTVQDMIADGTLERLAAGLLIGEGLPAFDVWPGDASAGAPNPAAS